MPIYIRTLGYKIYIWSNDFENARWGSAFYAPILRFFEKKQICCVQGREFAPFSLLYNSRKKILISPNCEFYKSSLYTETNENQNEKISDEF